MAELRVPQQTARSHEREIQKAAQPCFLSGTIKKEGRKNVKEQQHLEAEITKSILAPQKTCGSKELDGSSQVFWSDTWPGHFHHEKTSYRYLIGYPRVGKTWKRSS